MHCGRHIFLADTHEKDGESPWVSPTCSEMQTQMAGGPVRIPTIRVQAESGGSSFSVPPVPPMSSILLLQKECHTGLQVVSPVGATHCCALPVGVSGCTKPPPLMVFKLTSDRNNILGSNL